MCRLPNPVLSPPGYPVVNPLDAPLLSLRAALPYSRRVNPHANLHASPPNSRSEDLLRSLVVVHRHSLQGSLPSNLLPDRLLNPLLIHRTNPVRDPPGNLPLNPVVILRTSPREGRLLSPLADLQLTLQASPRDFPQDNRLPYPLCLLHTPRSSRPPDLLVSLLDDPLASQQVNPVEVPPRSPLASP